MFAAQKPTSSASRRAQLLACSEEAGARDSPGGRRTSVRLVKGVAGSRFDQLEVNMVASPVITTGDRDTRRREAVLIAWV